MKLDAEDCARLFGKLVMRADGCWHFLMNGAVVRGTYASVWWRGRQRRVRGLLMQYFGRPQYTRPCKNRLCVKSTHIHPGAGRPRLVIREGSLENAEMEHVMSRLRA